LLSKEETGSSLGLARNERKQKDYYTKNMGGKQILEEKTDLQDREV